MPVFCVVVNLLNGDGEEHSDRQYGRMVVKVKNGWIVE